MLLHRSHPCDVAPRAAKKYSTRVRDRLEKAKLAQKEAKQTVDKLNFLAQRVEVSLIRNLGRVKNYVDFCVCRNYIFSTIQDIKDSTKC